MSSADAIQNDLALLQSDAELLDRNIQEAIENGELTSADCEPLLRLAEHLEDTVSGIRAGLDSPGIDVS
jgi:hypothetical protein